MLSKFFTGEMQIEDKLDVYCRGVVLKGKPKIYTLLDKDRQDFAEYLLRYFLGRIYDLYEGNQQLFRECARAKEQVDAAHGSG